MSAPHADQLISGYLARLKEASENLPEGQRRELIADISAHLAEARHQLDQETDADVLNILDRLGEPSVVAPKPPTAWVPCGRQPPSLQLPSQGSSRSAPSSSPPCSGRSE